jgi:hypothetical protein
MAGIFVVSFPILAMLGILFSWARWLFFLEIAVYLLALLIAGLDAAFKHRDLILVLGVPLAIATMHFSWGTAFIWSMISR